MLIPRFSVIRLVNCPELSSWLVGRTSPLFAHDTVGNDNSSATHGSSIVRVAGRKRIPTKQCACADNGSKPARAITAMRGNRACATRMPRDYHRVHRNQVRQTVARNES